ncbi:MAG TPA: ABC transporter ATP-binding protein [Acidobacteriaceae bacterium]|nr:ABC transporter ATP-binding protein [Acidobacteriaceae bacterium]
MTESSVQKSYGDTWRSRLNALRNIPPVMKMVWECGPKTMVWSGVLRILLALMPAAILRVSNYIINAVVVSLRHHPASPLPGNFWWVVGLEFALACIAALLSRAIGFCDSLLGDQYMQHISVRVIEHASKLDITAFENPDYYDRLERAKAQATDRIAMIQMMGTLTQQVLTTAVLAVYIALYSPWLLLLLIAGTIPALLGESHFAFLGYAKNFMQTPLRRKMDYLRDVGGSKEAAKELKLFGLRDFLVGSFRGMADTIFAQNIDLSKRRLIAGVLLSILAAAGYYGAYALALWDTIAGRFSIADLTAVLIPAILQVSANLQQIFVNASGVADQALFLTDLLAFFDMQPTVRSKPNALKIPRPIRDGIEFRNVAFAYPGTTRLVLKDFNFHLHPGERVALIGENGQGKTTIVKLITRLYDPTEGQILIDGIDLREYDMEDLCHEIGVIFQDFMRYEMTARDNIAVGRIEERERLEHIAESARMSLADEVIARLPLGMEQQLGRRFEGGVDLSGGEWQRMALARAYLRDAQLLILDEPTSALDARSEQEVFQRFAELTRGKMSLLISHRFSTVKMTDRIVVLSHGVLTEEGSHDELIRQGGLYAEMFEMQAASYR